MVGAVRSALLTLLVRPHRVLPARALAPTALWAALVGVLGALAALGFRWLSTIGQWLLTRHTGSFVETAEAVSAPVRLVVPALGGLLAGLALVLARRFVTQPSPDYLEALVVGDGEIPAVASLARSGSSLLSIASGSSIGREGALVQLAATIASSVGRHLALPTARLRLLVACGAAAGFAAAYDAPVAAPIFMAELGFVPLGIDSLAAMLLSSGMAAATLRTLAPAPPLFLAPQLRLLPPLGVGVCLGLAVLAGVAAPGFLRGLALARSSFAATRLTPILRLGLGGLCVGALSISHPEVWGNGFRVARSMLLSEPAWQAVVATLLFKLLATGAAVGSGAVGGVFTPTLFVGAALGSLFGGTLQALWPLASAAPQACALVGMGAFLAAATHAPLMATVVLWEMSLDYRALPALALACVTANLVARAIDRRSLYSDSLGPRTVGAMASAKRA
jgi:chloride channel protein, CIC family